MDKANVICMKMDRTGGYVEQAKTNSERQISHLCSYTIGSIPKKINWLQKEDCFGGNQWKGEGEIGK
jgi:hypothetical protein